ncbi:unnamed protein product [Mytilus edulis]|uniref:Gonadal protein gdl n=1 Tax=Mytilus edulis TaxID=6550 RepID=A0A8S3SXL9_MYTED|nr:unnamed protein product [Mytilus edulis]
MQVIFHSIQSADTCDEDASQIQNTLMKLICELSPLYSDADINERAAYLEESKFKKRKFQQRLPMNLLSSLANALLDGTVFEIMRKYEVQHLEEKHLSSQRMKLINDHKDHGKRLEDEVKKRDMKIIMDLDQKVMDQQVMLERAGVPGFFVTNNRQDIRLQMYLLEFMNRLRFLDLPS